MSLSTPIRVVGVGSPQGDDAVAWRIVDALRGEVGAAAQGVELHQVDGGQRLLDLFDGRGTAVILDAAESAGPLGTMTRFIWPDDRLAGLRPGTTHDLGVEAALRLAEAIGTLPKHVVVYAIAADSFKPGDGLSASLAAAVPALARRMISDFGLSNLEAASCTKPRS